MANEILVLLIGNGVTLLVAAGGWFFAYTLHREEKSKARVKARVERLEAEVKARIFLEEEACNWLAELVSRPVRSVKLELRNRSVKRSGFRPNMSNADL